MGYRRWRAGEARVVPGHRAQYKALVVLVRSAARQEALTVSAHISTLLNPANQVVRLWYPQPINLALPLRQHVPDPIRL